jgi:hypothetical protein
VDGAKARALHESHARPYRAQQAQSRALHDHQNNEGAVVKVALGEIEGFIRQALVGKVEEVDREEIEREKIERQKAHDDLFAYEESELELKDEQSS